jgi:hypothetical protein
MAIEKIAFSNLLIDDLIFSEGHMLDALPSESTLVL